VRGAALENEAGERAELLADEVLVNRPDLAPPRWLQSPRLILLRQMMGEMVSEEADISNGGCVVGGQDGVGCTARRESMGTRSGPTALSDRQISLYPARTACAPMCWCLGFRRPQP
jgi:hypothetical protein